MLKQISLFIIILFSSIVASSALLALDMEAVLDSADGSSNLTVKDSASNAVFRVSSDGNVTVIGDPLSLIPWIGLGASAGRIVFDAASNYICIMDANVGIGIATPSTILHLNSVEPRLTFTRSDTSSSMIVLGRDAGAGGMVRLYNDAGAQTGEIRGGGDSYLAGGNFGIGIAAPTATLHLYGASGTTMRLDGNSSNSAINFQRATANNRAGVEYNYASDKLLLWTAGDYASPSLTLSNNGCVGVGTTGPSRKLDVYDSSTASSWVAQFLNNVDANAEYSGILFGNATKQGVLAHIYNTTDTSRYIALGVGGDDIISGVGLIVKKGGYVGIGTASPSAGLHVAAYTKLGSDAPAIKFLKLTGTTPSTQNAFVSIAHGLDQTKIISAVALVEKNAGQVYIRDGDASSGCEFNCVINGANINIGLTAANSSQLLSKPIKILITYEE